MGRAIFGDLRVAIPRFRTKARPLAVVPAVAARRILRATGKTYCPRPTHVRPWYELFEPLIPLPLFRNVPARPELNLYAEVVFDAVRLVRGEGLVVKTKAADVAAARAWILDGNVGVLTFDEACGWLGWDADQTRKAIFSTLRAAA
jgi:hypothetical protein